MVSSQSGAPDTLEDQKFNLEIERLQLENEKLRQELQSETGILKAWVIPLATPISILVTVLIAWVTWNNTIALQNQQAQNEFELKVAEVILSADTPSLAANRARALSDLFPERFSPNFTDTLAAFTPNNYLTGLSQESLLQERQMIFDARLTMLGWVWTTASENETIQDIILAWGRLVNGFEGNMQFNSTNASSATGALPNSSQGAAIPPLPTIEAGSGE